MRWFRFLAALALVAALIPGAALAGGKKSNMVFIFDCSGSMYKKVTHQGKQTTRFAVAQQAFLSAMNNLPTDNPNLNVSLMSYGVVKSCGDKTIKVIAPLAQHDLGHRVYLQELVDAMAPGEFGSTPIALSIRKSADIFKAHKDDINTLVLITDGEEECEAKTAGCAAVEKLSDDGLLTLSFVVGAFFGKQAKDAPPTIRCLGDFHTAENIADFEKGFKYVTVNSIVPAPLPLPPPPPPPPPRKKSEPPPHPPPPPPRPGILRIDVDSGKHMDTWTLTITDPDGKNVTGGGQLMGGGAPQFGRSTNRKLMPGKYELKVSGVGGRDRSPRTCNKTVSVPDGGAIRVKFVLDKCKSGFEMPAFPDSGDSGGFPF